MQNITQYGIIGCGMMGREHLRNIALLPNTNVSAIFEPNAEMAARAQELAPDARIVNSLSDLLAVPELDCLVIVSPNFCHVDQLIEIAGTRPLPILVEKPLLTDMNDLPRLRAFEASYPAPIWVAMEYRYMPPVAAFLAQAPATTGGTKVLSIREHRFPFLEKVGNWNRFNENTGGTFVEKCCHFFDLMRLHMQSEPLRIMASGGQDVNHLDEDYDGQTPNILDNGIVIVEFANGTRSVLELCMFAEGSRYQEEICAVGGQGKIEALVPGPGRFWNADLGPAPTPKLVLSPRSPTGPITKDIPVDPALLLAGDHNGATFYQHQGFLELVRGMRNDPEVSFDDGLLAVLMGMAAQTALKEHRTVEMSEFA
ncbi:MAG: Gfo/Idh/MocA family oxidoreductase [Sulfitobacter sp.]